MKRMQWSWLYFRKEAAIVRCGMCLGIFAEGSRQMAVLPRSSRRIARISEVAYGAVTGKLESASQMAERELGSTMGNSLVMAGTTSRRWLPDPTNRSTRPRLAGALA